MKSFPRHFIVSAVLAVLAPVLTAHAEEAPASPETWSWHAQSTVVEQWHGSFSAPYAGANSLTPTRQDKHTVTATGFFGRRLWDGAALFYNPEVSQGTGLSDTVGLAGFPNGEATRAGATSPQYNTARLFLRQTFGLGGERENVDSDQNQLAGPQDANRVVITLGKLSAVDGFDANRYSHDPRTQFLNWALMDNGAWDYPADVKGYTVGATVEWIQGDHALRYGWFLEPTEANGRPLDQHLSRAHGQVVEWEQKYVLAGRHGALRPLVYWNRARMGSYDEALRLPTPDVTATRRYSSKAGAGFSWEQELTDDVGLFARAGFNDGRNETWAFTEIDRTVTAGVSVSGSAWSRKDDTAGFALVGNGLSGPHRRYLAAGGLGFMVGDGRLNYAPEQILEAYYSVAVIKALSLAFDYQYARHPGYNADRGPVSIFALRAHVDL